MVSEQQARLRQLTVQGFKSFATRTVFEFGPGVTAIVGPNGSGKSNVADAFRWVLGEQNPRSLRLRKLEDALFAGGVKRGPAGFCQVDILFDNSDGWLPVDFQEVSVSRKLHRSGESEYLLNHTRVRLRDILDLFLKAQIGQNSYAILGQGTVDSVLSLRPEERRTLIEEAADVRRHRLKIDESSGQLSATRDNLDRVDLLLAEIAPRLIRLEEQAQQAAEFTQLTSALADSLRTAYGLRWQVAYSNEQTTGARYEKLQCDALALGEQIAQQETRLAQNREGIRASREAVAAGEREQRTCTDRVIESERRLREQRGRAQSLDQRRIEVEGDLAVLAEDETAAAVESSEIPRPDEFLSEAGERVKQREDEVQALEPALSQARDAVAALEAEGRRLRQDAGRVDENLDRLRRERQNVQRELARLNQRRREILGQLAGWAEKFLNAFLDQDRLSSASRDSQRELAAVERQAEAATLLRVKLEEQESALGRDLIACQYRVGLLESEQEARRPKEDLLLALLDALRGSGPGRPRVLGVAGGLIQVQRGFEVAIEAALAENLDAVILQTQAESLSAVRTLQEMESGRLGFFALDDLRSAHPLNVADERGIVGVASRFVRCDNTYRDLFDVLLGRVIIVENVEAGERVVKRGLATVVTLEGTVMQPGGAVVGGRGKADGYIFRSGQELSDLRERAASLEAARSGLLAELAAAKEKEQSNEERAQRVRGEVETRTRRARESQAAMDALRNRFQPMRSELEWLRTGIVDAARRLSALDVQEASLHQDDVGMRSRTERYEAEQLVPGRNRLEGLQQEHTRLTAALAGAHAELAAREHERTALVAMYERRRAAQERTARSIIARREMLSTLAGELQQTREAITATEAALLEERSSAEQAAALLQPVMAEMQRLGDEERSLEAALETSSHEEAGLRRALLEAELGHERASQEIERLRQEIEADEMDANALIAAVEGSGGDEQPSIDELEKRIRGLRVRIRKSGAINAQASADYQETKERHDFLALQVQDLREAEVTLLDAVDELRTIIRERFRETFQAVNTEFQRYFKTFFGGGQARLLLTEPEDYGESGVDIVAQPPGKRLQNLAMLSGGERAMTAVALLFALLENNPAPFCVLDEVDAALDEANVGRFGDALAQLAGNSQFLVITHNRRTVEVADQIYGISMTGESISNVLSLRLADAMPLAK